MHTARRVHPTHFHYFYAHHFALRIPASRVFGTFTGDSATQLTSIILLYLNPPPVYSIYSATAECHSIVMLGVCRNSSLVSAVGRRHPLSTKRVFHSTAKTKNGATSGGASFAERNPFVFQLAIATGKTAGADLMVQMVVEKKKLSEIDWRRNGIFVAFGFAYLGGFQYWIMVNKYRQWFPTMDRFAKMPFAEKIKDTAGIIDAAKMVAFDIFVHLPFMYFPSYYTCKEFVTSDSWNPIDWVTMGCSKYYGNMKEDLPAMVKLWGPSDCIQFVLPLHIRLPFRHFVSFFWTAFVSFTRGGSEESAEEIERHMSSAGPE